MAARTSKIACSIDTHLLASVERLRVRTGESRSAVIARALAGLVGEQEHQRRVQAYVQAYRDQPESAAEVRKARVVAQQALSQFAWNDS